MVTLYHTVPCIGFGRRAQPSCVWAVCFALILLFLSGCASSGPKLVSANAIPVFDQMVYTGSDEQFHYFKWSREARREHLKVEKAQLKLSREFPLGTNAKFVDRTPDGKIDLMFLDQQDDAVNKTRPILSQTNATRSAARSNH